MWESRLGQRWKCWACACCLHSGVSSTSQRIVKRDVFSRATLKYLLEHANSRAGGDISSHSRGMLPFHIRHRIKPNDTLLPMLPGALSSSRVWCSERTALSKIRFSQQFLSARTDGRHQTSNPHLHGNPNATPLTSEDTSFLQANLPEKQHFSFPISRSGVFDTGPSVCLHGRANGSPDSEDGGVVSVSHLSHDPM